MAVTLKIRKLGNSLGLIVPKELSDRLHLKEGDSMHATIDAGGEMVLSPYDPNFEAALAAYKRTRAKYRNALRKLAK
jgi:putative addiction module antidote